MFVRLLGWLVGCFSAVREMQDGLGFVGHLVVNSLFIYPVTKRILGNKEKSIERRKLTAILFLAFVGLAAIALDLFQILNDERNLFKIMGVSRSCSQEELRKSYQRLARELHPDKNMAPNAEQQFVEMKDAYEILSIPQLRDAYDKWGLSGVKTAKEPDGDPLSEGLVTLGITYVVWFAMTILLTVSSSHTHSRTITLAGLALIVSVELSLKTAQESSMTFPFFPYLTIHQLTKLLFTAYPTYISGTIVFQNMTYIDPVLRNWQLLSVVFQNQQNFERRFTELEQELRLAGKAGALPSGAAARGAPVSASGASNSSLPRNLQAKNNAGASNVKQPKEKSGIPPWVFMIGMYVLFNFVLK